MQKCINRSLNVQHACVCKELSECKTKKIPANKGPMFSPIRCLLATGESKSREREIFNFRRISSSYTYSLDRLQKAIYRGQLTLRAYRGS